MAAVSTYLNFARETEAAFNFYKSVFGGEFLGMGIMRMGGSPGTSHMPEADQNLVMHVSLMLPGGHVLMGSDVPESSGHSITRGSDFYIVLDTDTREEADNLYKALSAGGTPMAPMADMFWGAYWGNLRDAYGVQWMINHTPKQ